MYQLVFSRRRRCRWLEEEEEEENEKEEEEEEEVRPRDRSLEDWTFQSGGAILHLFGLIR